MCAFPFTYYTTKQQTSKKLGFPLESHEGKEKAAAWEEFVFQKEVSHSSDTLSDHFLDRLDLRQWWWVVLYLDPAHLIMHTYCLPLKSEPNVRIPKMRVEVKSH